MHLELQIAFSHAFKDNVNQTAFNIGGFETMITTWNGIPIISTRNMANGTEKVITGL